MENPFFFLFLGLLVAWVSSFLYSMQINRRKLMLMARWLEDALSLLGSRPTSRWNNQNTLSINLNEGRGRITETLIVLAAQKRDLVSLIVSAVRGGKDSFSILIAINPPTRAGAEFEIFRKGEPIPKMVSTSPDSWMVEDYLRNNTYQIAARRDAAYDSASRLLTLLLDDRYAVRRVSVRPTTPHLMFVFDLNRLPQVDAHDLFQLIRNLVDEVTDSPRGGNNLPATRLPGKKKMKQLSKVEAELEKNLPLSGKLRARKPEGPSLN